MAILSPTEIALQGEVQRLQARVAALECELETQATVIENAPVMISIVRAPDFVYEMVNPAFQALAPGKTFIGRRFAEVWAEVSAPLVEILQNVIKTGQTFREEDFPYSILRGSGGPPEVVYVTYSWIPLFAPDGKADRILTLAYETTAAVRQRKAEEALRGEQALLDATIQLAPVGIAIIDAQGAILRVNAAVRSAWGGTAPLSSKTEEYAEYKGWWPDTGEPLKLEDWPPARVLKGETVRDQMIDIERFDGTRGTLLVSGAPMRGDVGKSLER